MEEGQSPSASSFHNSGPNVSAVSSPTGASQASTQAIPSFSGAPQVLVATVTLRALLEPPAARVGAAAADAAPVPAPAEAPLAAVPKQQ